MATIDDAGLDLLFRAARTHNGWRKEPVSRETLHALYDLLKFGPTSANCSPARFKFIVSDAAKQRLAPALAPGNLEKTMAAPVVTIVAIDTQFYDHIPKLFPHNPGARDWFTGPANAKVSADTAFRNGTLQGAYLIIAARALGLDCGPMSGFDAAKVDAEFFADGRFKSNFLCSIGHGEPSKLFPRGPRLSFDEAAEIL